MECQDALEVGEGVADLVGRDRSAEGCKGGIDLTTEVCDVQPRSFQIIRIKEGFPIDLDLAANLILGVGAQLQVVPLDVIDGNEDELPTRSA